MPLKKITLLFSLLALCLSSHATPSPELPEPVSNNAVAKVELGNDTYLLSFMGLGSGKSWRDVHNKVWSLKLGDEAWQARKAVPSSLLLKGRLASIAVGIGDSAYLFGGYTVAKDHSEISSPDNFRYQLEKDEYQPLTAMPVAVDDAVALVYQQRYIYLLSGWHNDGNVNLVQLYDTLTDSWQQATPYPGAAVFGHAGGIVNDVMVVCDGVKVVTQANKRRTFAPVAACYKGKVNPDDLTRIDWRLIPHPTGKARYRMAASGVTGQNSVVFFGGSENPYNYNGIGYNGQPSEPTDTVWQFDINGNQWRMAKNHFASMDHRALIVHNETLIVTGGMGKQQQVLSQVARLAYQH